MGLFHDLDIAKLMLDMQCDITDLVDIIQEKLETWETEENNPEYLSVSNSIENKITEKDKIIHKNIKEEPLDIDINDMNHEDKGVLVNHKSAKHKEYGLRWPKLK